MNKIKPIHKFNNGLGATLCNKCSCIIKTGLTNDLYCKPCLIQMEKEVKNNNSNLNK